MSDFEGKIISINISENKGTVKKPIDTAKFIEDFGIENDAHAGHWHRQVSLLSYEKILEFNEKGNSVKPGDFGENLTVSGIDLKNLPVGSEIVINQVHLKVTQIGKKCNSKCTISKMTGECIMPHEGIFAEVISGGVIKTGDKVEVFLPKADRPFRAAVITMSDKGSRGERVDESGPLAEKILKENGYEVFDKIILPDERSALIDALIEYSDRRQADLVITSGGTGFSKRDITPEATMAVAEKNVPGISEYMRMKSMEITERAMLSRGVSVIRKNTLIVNLPGSPKAVEESLGFILPSLEHGLRILRGTATECARA